MTDVAQQYETIPTERIGEVERITLNRPEKRNAMSFTLQRELVAAVHAAEYDKDVRCIVIRGAGSSFCAGYDLGGSIDELPYGGGPLSVEEDVDLCMSFGEKWGQLWNCRVPVIAQVHGYCVAGGTDPVVASANPGCTMHLRAVGLDVRHPATLLRAALDAEDRAEDVDG